MSSVGDVSSEPDLRTWQSVCLPNGPCIHTAAPSTTTGLSQVKLFWLLLPALVRPIV